MWPSLLKLLCSIGSRLSNIFSGQALTSTRVDSLLHRIGVTICANVASLLKSGFTVFRDLPWGPPTPLTVAMSKRRSWSTKQRSANRPGKHERAQLTATIRRTAGVKRAARKPHAAENALTRVPPPPPAPPDRDRHAAPSSTACMSYAVTPQSHKPGLSSSSEPGSDAAQLHLDALRGRLYSRLLQQQVMPFPTFVTLQPLPCTGGGHVGAHCVAVGSQAPDRTAQHAYTALLLPVASVILCFSLLLWRGLFAPRALAHLQLQALDGVIFMAMWAVSLHCSLSVWSYSICRLAMEGSPFKGDLHLRRWTPRWGPGLLSLDPFRLISDNLSHQVSRRRIGQARQRRTRSSRLQAVCLLAMLATGLGWKTHQTIAVVTSRSSQSSLLLSRLFGAYHPCPFMSYLVRQGPYALRGAVPGRRRPPRRRHHRSYHIRTPASSICEGLLRMGCSISMMRAAGLAAILTASASRLSLLRRPLTHHMHAQTHTLQVQTRHLTSDAMIRSSSTYSSTMSGPKSGRHCSSFLSCPRLAAFLLLLWAQLHAVSGVRVGAAASQHAPGVSSQPQLCSNLEGTKIGTHTEHKPNTWHRVRKRAFRRAIARARRSSEGRALYRGRWVVASDDPKDRASQLTAGPSSRPAPRIPILCWNCSGLTTLRFEEIKQWLRSQPPKDRPQLVVLQETMWKDCMEWTDDLYAYIHSGSGRNREGGLMVMVSQQLCPAERLRHHSLQAGRLLHVKVPLEPSIEVLAVYQHAWRSDANNAAKEALLAKRLACWQRIQCFAEATAARSQLLILGDFNTPLSLRHPFTGQGLRNQVPRTQQHTLPDSKHSTPDADVFCYILQCCDLQAQNTFRRSGTHCATFRNCSTKAFTQIDFILTRRTQADDQSRCAQPVRTFPLLPTDGMFHYPVFCTVPRTRAPRTPKTSASLPRVRPDVATLMLQQHPAQGQAFFDLVQTRLRHAHSPACVNDILLSSWHMIFGLASKSAAPTPGPCLSQLWYHRRLASEASTVFARWRHAVQYRAVRKALHVKAIVAKRARLQQLLQDAEHANGSRNPSALYQVLRRIAPRVRRRRMQLRDENNRLAGPQDEVRLVAKHFAEVFDATSACDGFLLKEDFCFTAAEFHDYLLELPLHKALPPHCAPAPLWRLCSEAISEFTVRCLNGCLRAGPFADQWPSEWSVSYLCLLPKTDQALDSVGKMRPISLLHPLGKSFAGLLMGRVREDISRRMQPYPQYAYLAGRSTADAVDRAFWHVCQTQTRTGQQFTLHHRRAGHAPKTFLGSITLSVDLSKAFDSISRTHIRSSLEWAGIPTRVIDVVLGLHHSMTLNYQNSGFRTSTATGRGVRQGCRLAPILWCCFTGWLLSKLMPVLSAGHGTFLPADFSFF